MSHAAAQLADDVEALKVLLIAQTQEHAAELERQRSRIAHLEEQRRLLIAKRLGASSVQASPSQLGLFTEAEGEPAAESTVTVPAHERRRGHRAPLPDFIERVEVVHDLAEADKQCPTDGAALVRIGEETSEQLDVIPAQVRVLRHVRYKYACPCCQQNVKCAALPPQPIPKSQASPGLLAHIAVAKYLDALPLYRQSQQWARVGVDLDRTTLAQWMVKVGELLLPLLNLMQEKLLSGPLLHMDETTVQVLKEPGKIAQSKSYMWVRLAGPPGEGIVVYDYDPSRSAEVPKKLLAGFSGALLTDGYEGYAAVVREQALVHAGCWAHARRKFDEALKARQKSSQPNGGKASKALYVIGQLYQIERELRELDADARREQRQERSKPILDELRQWLDVSLAEVAPQSLTGKALQYLHTQWPRLMRYLDDGRIPIDNNLAQNAIRPFVMGRKNWLFSDSVSGARSSAAIYSVLQSAKLNGLEPYRYLRRVLADLPKAQSVEDIEAVLPFASIARPEPI